MSLEQLYYWISIACMAGAAFGCLYMVVAGILALRFGRGSQTPRAVTPVPVTILVPLCGHEPGLEARLHALATQTYAAPVQLLCGVRDAADPTVAVVEKLAAELPPGTIALHADPRLHGRNLKISNLMNMLEHARHDVFIMIDSDIEVGPDYLTCVVGELQQPQVGAVTCLYYGVAKGGVWAHLAAMGINLQFLPSAIVALHFGLARPCFGATIAITRAMLAEIGGLARFADQLWDDYAIGEAVRAAGRCVAVPPMALAHVCADVSALEMFGRKLRYARTIGGIDRAGHAGAIITHPFALSLVAIAFGGDDAAIALALTALACRVALSRCIAFRFSAGPHSYRLLVFRDLAAFAIYVMSFFGGTVTWRGHRYRIGADGTLLRASQ